jgi:hypothetical protein
MKINITKALVITLIISILIVTGSLCLKNQDGAHASSDHIAMEDDAINDSFSADPCYRWQPSRLLADKLSASAQLAGPGNSFLPCCYDGDGSKIATTYRSENLNQPVHATSFIFEWLASMTLRTAVYKNPSISPPELPSILAAVIRA